MVGRKGAHNMDWTAEFISGLLDVQPEDRVLDLCCGNGLVTIRVAKRVNSVMGVDFSAALLAQAQSDFSAPNITYRHGDARDLSKVTAGEIFDKAYISFAFQYFDEKSGQDVLRGLHRVLKPGGRLALVDIPNKAMKRRHQLRAALRLFLPAGQGTGSSDSNQRFKSLGARVRYLLRNAATVVGLRKADDLGWWWKRDTLVAQAREIGFDAETFDQPEENPHHLYRFDAVLRRLG
jgi:ubiquinone/menaquinone biosynthesis C-methylase UbiE